ncbi:MAG: carbonic anhydrase [Candidatus Nanopelagicales bacterium]
MANVFSDSEKHFPQSEFADVLEANSVYAESFQDQHLTGSAAKGLAVVTCMDSRIDPLGVLGMRAGDVKIVRNAGARVTSDVLRTLTLAHYLLNVSRILVMPHTSCKMASATDEQIWDLIYEDFGVDTRSLNFHTVQDQMGALALDVQKIRSAPLLPKDITVGGALYDVATGRINPVEV